MDEKAAVKMQRSLKNNLLTCLYGNPKTLRFESCHRNCYYLCCGGGAGRVESVLTDMGRFLAHMNQKTAGQKMALLQDICLHYESWYAGKRGPTQFRSFFSLHNLYTKAVEARRKWAIKVCARIRRRARARAIFDKYLYDAVMRRLGKPGGFYERRALASGRWSAPAAAPAQATGKKRPRD